MLPPDAPQDPTPPNAADAADGSTPDPKHRPMRSFVLRAGRMGTGQLRALETLGPRFLLPYRAEVLDLDATFGRHAPRVLEIGFGMGDATAQVAAALPGTDFIGVEVHAPGVGALLKHIGEKDLQNLRLLQHDAVEVMTHMLPPASLAGVHIWFPDPWHKKRHNKRRLIQPAFIQQLVTRIAPGGYLHCATDWQDYCRADAGRAGRRASAAEHGRGLCPSARLATADEVREPRLEARPRRVGPGLHTPRLSHKGFRRSSSRGTRAHRPRSCAGRGR